MLMSVVLPAPFSPSRACTSPGLTSRLTSSLATTPGNFFVMFLISSSGGLWVGGRLCGEASTTLPTIERLRGSGNRYRCQRCDVLSFLYRRAGSVETRQPVYLAAFTLESKDTGISKGGAQTSDTSAAAAGHRRCGSQKASVIA